MSIRSWHVAVLVVVAVFGTIAATAAAGVWTTESTRVPRRIASGEAEGSYDPADIRGSYAFADVERAFAIPVDVLAAAFGVASEDPASYQAKELEEQYGERDGMEIGTDSLRLFVALYLDLPYEPEETTALPQQARRVLVESVAADQERVAAYASRFVRPETAEPAATGVAQSPPEGSGEEVHTPATDGTVRGRTTFADLLEWGLTRDQIEEVIGGEMPARGTLVRDYAVEHGGEFATWRDRLQTLLDELE